jgi:hypothetical protein
MCCVCLSAVTQKRCNTPKETAFLCGFSNWKKAIELFKGHENSAIHKEAVKISMPIDPKQDISRMFVKENIRKQNIAYESLSAIFKAIRFLGCQGLALRGHGHKEGNFVELVKELAQQDAREWLKRRDNFLSDTIQNEILEIFGHEILRKIVCDVSLCSFIGLICDSTTDVSGSEQLSTIVRYCTPELEVREHFLGFYEPPDSTANTTTAVIKDVFLRLNIPLEEKLQGFAFDGANYMSGRIRGVQAQLREVYPNSIYVHCANHALDLVLQELVSSVDLIGDSLVFVHQCALLAKDSPKRKGLWEEICGAEAVQLLAICPTRWCVRGTALVRAERNYIRIQEFLSLLLDDNALRPLVKATVSGLHKQSMKAKTLLGLKISSSLFGLCEPVARGLQHVNTTAGGCLQAIRCLKQSLSQRRTDEAFEVCKSHMMHCLSF